VGVSPITAGLTLINACFVSTSFSSSRICSHTRLLNSAFSLDRSWILEILGAIFYFKRIMEVEFPGTGCIK